MSSPASLDATEKNSRPRDRLYLRPEVLEWLEPEGRVPYGRARALETLVAAYTKERRVLTGITLWLGAALGAVLLCVGTGMVAEGIVTSEPGLTLTAVVLLLLGLPLAWLSWRYGVPLLRAGRALTRAAVGWLGDGEESITGFEEYVVSHRMLYRGPVFFRLMLSSVTGLAVFCFGPVTGYCLAQLPGQDPSDTRILATLAAAGAILAVLSAVPAVALFRGARRLQRVLVWQEVRGA